MDLSPPHNDSSSRTASSSLPINQPQPSLEAGTSTTAEGGETATAQSPESHHHGSSISAAHISNHIHNEDTSTTAPPSISGSTATGTTTTTMVSGASSTSSPPPLFPPLAHHHGGGIGAGAAGAGIAPPQLSVTNAVHHAHFTPHHPHHSYGHAHDGPSSHSHHGGQIHGSHAAGPSRPMPPPPSSTSSGPHNHIYHPNLPNHNPSHPAGSHPPSQPQQVSTPREIESARNAVVASIGNMLDRELSGRATQLHANNAAIEKQEREMAKSLESFRKENDKLAKLATDHTKKIKEIGNVQNWAELLEREFLILETTLRMANRPSSRRRRRKGDGEGGDEENGGDGGSEEGSWSGIGSWSGSGSYSGIAGSYAGSEAGDDARRDDDTTNKKKKGETAEGDEMDHGDDDEDGKIASSSGIVNGVTAAAAETTVSSSRGEQEDRQDVQDPGGSMALETTTTAIPFGQEQKPGPPIMSGKGKQREGDIQLALAEAMETSLILDISDASDAGDSSAFDRSSSGLEGR